LHEKRKSCHSAKQKQGEKALFWCAELDLADRTLFTAPNRQQPTVGHPVKFVFSEQISRLFVKRSAVYGFDNVVFK
jgi:hypothetical protein